MSVLYLCGCIEVSHAIQAVCAVRSNQETEPYKTKLSKQLHSAVLLRHYNFVEGIGLFGGREMFSTQPSDLF